MGNPKLILPLLALGVALLAQPAYAHGFGDRYDLPVPLGYFLVGAGVAVALSFAIIGLYMRSGPSHSGYWRYDLFKHGWLRAILTCPATLLPVKLLSVFLLGLVIATGFVGAQTPSSNFAPVFVWIIWWVGMGFVAALVGNLWALINPWKILFEWAEWLHARIRPGGSLSLNAEYPRDLGIWPALVLFLAFAWAENSYSEGSIPSRVAVMVVVYSAMTLGGMVVFGKHRWLKHGEAFSVVFGLLARFAPTEVRVGEPDVCRVCGGGCPDLDGECVNCYECFERVESKELNIRPFTIGLARSESVTNDVLVMVILLLSIVTFDGFSATPAWVDVQSFSLDIFAGTINNVVFNGLTIADTLGLLLFPVAFLLVYLAFSYLMSASVGNSVGVGDLTRAFVYSLIPIALAYNIAHFITLLIIQGQLIIPTASNPFGLEWDLFGTADYKIDIGVINAKVVWFLSVGLIVLGHVMAVYLAHYTAMRLFRDRMTALKSQYPMLTLMVAYTVVSLWIIAQPIMG